jgi:hypothetical protein
MRGDNMAMRLKPCERNRLQLIYLVGSGNLLRPFLCDQLASLENLTYGRLYRRERICHILVVTTEQALLL